MQNNTPLPPQTDTNITKHTRLPKNKKVAKIYLSVLSVLSKLLKELPSSILPEICLVGSVNLYLQGVSIEPKKDLDIGTNYKNIILLSKIFEDITVRLCLNKRGNDYLPFAHLFIKYDGFEIEFFDTKDYGGSYYLKTIKKENMQELKIGKLVIPALSLEKELGVYKKTDKLDKVEILKQHLQKV